MTEKILVNSFDAAELLSCSRSHFMNMVRLKKLPQGLKLGGRCRRWSTETLRDWAVAESEKINGK